MIENPQMSLSQICILKTLKNKPKQKHVLHSHFRAFVGEGKTSIYLYPDLYALVSWKVTLHHGLSLSPYPVGSVTHLLAKFIIQSEIPKDIVMKNFLPAFFPWARYKLP